MKAPIRWAKGLEPLLVPIDQVKQHPENPNNGDDENTIESIKINGFVTAVTADVNTGYIIAGNTRYRALHALGAEQIPVIWVDHWGEEGAKRYMIGDNQASRRAVMDESALLEMLKEMQSSEIGLFGTGFDDDDVEALAMSLLHEDDMGEEQGFGAGEAPEGIFQVVLDFEDADERDMAWIVLQQEYGSKARTVNL